MNKTVTYYGVEKIEYKFQKGEILDALLKEYKISLTGDYEFNLSEEDGSSLEGAELVLRHAKKIDDVK